MSSEKTSVVRETLVCLEKDWPGLSLRLLGGESVRGPESGGWRESWRGSGLEVWTRVLLERAEQVRVVGRACSSALTLSHTYKEGDWEPDPHSEYRGHLGAGWKGACAFRCWGGEP